MKYIKMGENSRLYSTATAEIMKYLNVENAKVCAFLLVIGFALYHGLIHARYGGDSCHWLLTEGRLQGENIWQPFGCMVHKYTQSEMRNCMHYISYWGGTNHIVFLGDSRVRQQYQTFVSLVAGEDQNESDGEKVHHDLNFIDKNINLKVEFLWNPVINTSMYELYESWLSQPHKKRPSIIVTGSGTWNMKLFNGSNEGLDDYKANLTSLLEVMNKLGNSTNILWMLQEQVDEKICQNYSRGFLTNQQVHSYNTAAKEILKDTSVKIWSSSRIIAEELARDTLDGLHHGKVILSWDSQVLVNLYCNDHMNFDDGTCCSSREPVTSLQIISASIFSTCLFLAICLFIWNRRKVIKKDSEVKRTKGGETEGENLIPGNEEHEDRLNSEDNEFSDADILHGNVKMCSREAEVHVESPNRQKDHRHTHCDASTGKSLQPCYNEVQNIDGCHTNSSVYGMNNTRKADSKCYNRNGNNLTISASSCRNSINNVNNHDKTHNVVNNGVHNVKSVAIRIGQMFKSNKHRMKESAIKNKQYSYKENGIEGNAGNESVLSNVNIGSSVLSSKSITSEAVKSIDSQTASFYDLVLSLGRLGIIMMYFFLCDRTYFFMKENKYYTHVNFFLPFSYLMILGFFFTEKSQYTTVLHRDQTDEWKGWMQLVILIYHMTGASKVLSIYMQIRVLVSSYLFLSGFGHFYYFFITGNFSLTRFCKVMFRFNFLVVLLCFTMNRPYQFYYFVPLVSFWFLVMYITMGIWPQITASSTDVYSLHYLYLVLKFAVLVIAITLLYASEVLFEDIFLSHPIKSLFVTSDDSIHDFRFRWKIDRYSTVFGMLFAFALLVSKKLKVVVDSKPESLFSRGFSWLVGVLAIAGLGGYFIFANFCRNKEECNEVHAYIAFLPIISFIVLRNLPGWLRVKYSSFFAWFGRIALELFISQYHIWLASDTHGILVLVPSNPVLNLTVTSFIFVCAAHEIHTVTGTLVQYFVPDDWKSLLRNIILFFIVLLPVAITRGAFG